VRLGAVGVHPLTS